MDFKRCYFSSRPHRLRGQVASRAPRRRPETSFLWWTIPGLVREDSEKTKSGPRDTCYHFSSYRDQPAAVEIQPTAASRVPSREPTRTRRRLASTKNSDGASRTAVTAYSSPRTPFRTTKGSHRHRAGGKSSTRTRAPDVSETGTHLIGTQHPYSWCNAGYMTWLARAMSTHRLLQTVNHSALPGAAASAQLRTNHSAPVR